jgi:proline iminopeptidase
MDASIEKMELFPQLEPFEHGTLDLDGLHQMYWEQSGNPDGVPVVFLHGGPGAGASPTHRRFFDPGHYRIVIFDQRGAGRSKPYAEVQNNTTAHLVDDIEHLRQHLGIDKWLIFGGSWGVTLALSYGVAHPDRCLGFILRGVFLGTNSELDWFLNGIATVFPEARRNFVEFLPEEERGNLVDSYYSRLTDDDPNIHRAAAAAWCRFEGACSTLLPGPQSSGSGGSRLGLVALARIEAHYFKYDMFLKDRELLNKIYILRDHPATLIQGRYDMVCPITTADTLAQSWPGAEFVIVPDAGHSALEPGIRSALIKASERFKALTL